MAVMVLCIKKGIEVSSNWHNLNLLLSYVYSYLLIERIPSDLESLLQWIQLMEGLLSSSNTLLLLKW